MRKVLYIMGQLDDSDIEWMARAGRTRPFAPGEALIRQGQDVRDLFIVLEGKVEVLVAGVGVVASLATGEILGEMSFVDKSPPSASVIAREPTKVLALDKARMEDHLRKNPPFAARFYRALAIFLADRLRDTTIRGKTGGSVKPGVAEEDELDDMVLDGVSVAGLRFQQMLTTLSAAGA